MPRTYDEWVDTKYGIVEIKGERQKRVRKIEERKMKKQSRLLRKHTKTKDSSE